MTTDTELLTDSVTKLVKKSLDDLKITDYKIEIKPGTVKGDNFLSTIYDIEVNGVDATGNTVTLNWLAKCALRSEALREMLNQVVVFEREVFVYTQVFPVFVEFQKEKGLSDIFEPFPRLVCYSLDNMAETLIMENLKKLGFGLKDRKKPVDLETARYVMRAYGKYHALSYALKDQKPEVFERLAEKMPSTMKKPADDKWNESFNKRIKYIARGFDPVTQREALEKLTGLIDRSFEALHACSLPAGKWSVLAHGDCWTNNFLFKFDDPEDKNPSDMRFVDFQLSCQTAPAVDLLYFVAICTDKKLRDEHFDELIEEYYDSLKGFLEALGSNADELLPFEKLQQLLKERGAYGFVIAITLLFFVLCDSNEIPDMEKMSEEADALFESKKKGEYRKNISNLLEFYVERGFDL